MSGVLTLLIPTTVLLLTPAFAAAQEPANAGNPQDAKPQIPPPRIQTPAVPPPVTLPPPGTPPKVVFDKAVNAEEAAQIALRFQPTIDAARGQVTSAQGRTRQARSGLLPQVGVNAAYNSVQTLNEESNQATNNDLTVSAGGISNGFNVGLSVRQLLFDFNHTRDLTRQARATELATNQGLLLAQNDLVFQVKSAFYQVNQALRLVRVNEQNVANRQSQFDLANARFRAGLGQPLDLVTAETARTDAIVTLTTARQNAETARINLALTMGLDPQTPVQITETEEPTLDSGDVGRMVDTALKQRPEVRQAEANREAARLGIQVARTTNTPVVSGSLGFGGRGVNVPPGDDTFFAGLSVSFFPFDGGLTSGRVQEARGSLKTAEANLASTQLIVRGDVTRAYIALRSAEQNVVTSEANVANAQENVRIAEGRYRTGLGQFLDILNAQAFLLTAQTNLTNAQLNRDQARAALKRAVGQPFPAPPPIPPR